MGYLPRTVKIEKWSWPEHKTGFLCYGQMAEPFAAQKCVHEFWVLNIEIITLFKFCFTSILLNYPLVLLFRIRMYVIYFILQDTTGKRLWIFFNFLFKTQVILFHYTYQSKMK